jgi:hypothetical protein
LYRIFFRQDRQDVQDMKNTKNPVNLVEKVPPQAAKFMLFGQNINLNCQQRLLSSSVEAPPFGSGAERILYLLSSLLFS